MTAQTLGGYISSWDSITDEYLQDLASQATSQANLLELLGYERIESKGGRTFSGGARDTLVRQIIQRGTDTSHWKRPLTRSFKKFLVFKKGIARPSSMYLRLGLIELGIPYECADPGHVFDPRPLPLDVEHKNGNPQDCRQENLEFLCSNCHSLRPTSSKSRSMKA